MLRYIYATRGVWIFGGRVYDGEKGVGAFLEPATPARAEVGGWMDNRLRGKRVRIPVNM